MFHSISKIPIIVITLITLLFCTITFADDQSIIPTQQMNNEARPIAITSDKLEARSKFSEISFIGNVVAKSDDLTILSNTLNISYTAEKDIKSIIAYGEVKIVKNVDTAYADSAVYLPETQQIHLKGNAKVERQGSTIEGDSIHISVKEEISIVESGTGKRIKAVIMPGGGQ